MNLNLQDEKELEKLKSELEVAIDKLVLFYEDHIENQDDEITGLLEERNDAIDRAESAEAKLE